MRWMNKKKKSTTTATRKSYNQLQPVRLPSNQIHQLTGVPPTQISLQFWSPAQLDSIQRHFFCLKFDNLLNQVRKFFFKFLNFFIHSIRRAKEWLDERKLLTACFFCPRTIHSSVHSFRRSHALAAKWMNGANKRGEALLQDYFNAFKKKKKLMNEVLTSIATPLAIFAISPSSRSFWNLKKNEKFRRFVRFHWTKRWWTSLKLQ